MDITFKQDKVTLTSTIPYKRGIKATILHLFTTYLMSDIMLGVYKQCSLSFFFFFKFFETRSHYVALVVLELTL